MIDVGTSVAVSSLGCVAAFIALFLTVPGAAAFFDQPKLASQVRFLSFLAFESTLLLPCGLLERQITLGTRLTRFDKTVMARTGCRCRQAHST